MNRLSLFLKITAVIFLTFFLGKSNVIAQATVCPTTSSYTYGNYYGPSDAVDFVVANPTDLITMTFTSGSTESNWDYWYITDGAGGTGNVIATDDGSISTSTTYTSTTGTISFYVDADGSQTGTTFEYTVTCSTPPSCLPLTSVTATATSASTIDVVITDPNSASEYFVTYSDGVTTDTVSPNPTDTAVTLTGLTSNTSYTVSVRAICGAADSSDVSSASATTPCAFTLFHTVRTSRPLCQHVGQSIQMEHLQRDQLDLKDWVAGQVMDL